jgi:hypothetical protein
MNGTAENSWLARQLPAAALVTEFVRREGRDRDLDRHVITPHPCVPTPTCRLWSIKYLETEIAQPWMVVRATARAANEPERHLKEVTNVSLIFRRAQESLVFTLASLIPSACTVSAILSFCTSRNTNTVRYFSGSEFRALKIWRARKVSRVRRNSPLHHLARAESGLTQLN